MQNAYPQAGGVGVRSVWLPVVDVRWLPVAVGLASAIPEVASQNVRTSTYRIELTGMGIMEALPVAGSGVFLLPYCRWLVFMPSRCPCEALDNGGELCMSHADPGGLSKRVHRLLTDRLDSWIAGMIRPSCTKSSRFSRNSWSIPRANLALYYRRPLRRWSAPATGCYRSLSMLTGGFRGVDGFIRHLGGLGP